MKYQKEAMKYQREDTTIKELHRIQSFKKIKMYPIFVMKSSKSRNNSIHHQKVVVDPEWRI